MASISEILARARTIATQRGADPNTSPVMDNLAGARALLDQVVQEVYRRKANDKKNYHDITTRHTVAVTASTGAIPDEILREFLPQANFQDANNSLIAYIPYAVDYSSGVNFSQLGYVTIQGDNFLYRAPAPNQSYTGNLYVTAVTLPTLPSNWSTALTIGPDTVNDIVAALAEAMVGNYSLVAPE